MRILDLIWNGWLEYPLAWISNAFGFDTVTQWKSTAWKIFIVVAILVLLYETLIRSRNFYRKRLRRTQDLADPGEPSNFVASDSQFTQSVMAARDVENTVAPLKKARRYDRVAEIYASVNRPKDAAKWFRKAGDKRRAGMEWAKAGYTLKAARMLSRAGDHATAARFFSEKGKHRHAARAFLAAGQLAAAAGAFAQARRWSEATEQYGRYFRESKDATAEQVSAAEGCFAMLQQPAAKKKIPAEERKRLLGAIAARYAAGNREDLAIKLYQETGDPGRAGEILLRQGRLEEAARCMQAAGRTQDAALIGARFLESQGRMPEAARAYEQAGDFKKAGDCHAKAQDPERAAACYARAGEYFGAGFALLHGKHWEQAVPMFQKMKEDDPHFNESRMLLGRCFYEISDFAHCAATLENHLTGERVRKVNIEYFWMLALAYEQLGDLDNSKRILEKIGAVDREFRDVSARLSNIRSRISMMGSQNSGFGGGSMSGGEGPPSGQPTAVMDAVESALGQRYKIERELGRGGMGVVYLAKDTQLDRPVALKFLGSLLDNSQEYRERFIREARAAAKVSHPNIISIYDISASEGQAYIAMEYINGPNLKRYLDSKGKLSPREAVSVMSQACAALHAIHEAGIVHRDVKPDNIIVAKGGLVKLMDFGLAKGAGNRLTASNVVMGTPSYMPPEQAMGNETDERSDIYSMGMVMHEILTGQTVFLDGNVLKRQIEETPPRPGTLAEGIPELLDQIVMKAIAKRPEERFQSAKEMLQWLRQAGAEVKA